MEIGISNLRDFPDDSILSVRCGSTRRQAKLSVWQANTLSFPQSTEVCETMVIDVLQMIASLRLVLAPKKDAYELEFERANNSNMFCSMNVNRNLVLEGNKEVEPINRTSSYKDAAASARQYLEDTQLLPYIQGLLSVVVQEKPEDPFSFLLQQLAASTGSKISKASDKAPPGASESGPPSPISTVPPSAADTSTLASSPFAFGETSDKGQSIAAEEAESIAALQRKVDASLQAAACEECETSVVVEQKSQKPPEGSLSFSPASTAAPSAIDAPTASSSPVKSGRAAAAQAEDFQSLQRKIEETFRAAVEDGRMSQALRDVQGGSPLEESVEQLQGVANEDSTLRPSREQDSPEAKGASRNDDKVEEMRRRLQNSLEAAVKEGTLDAAVTSSMVSLGIQPSQGGSQSQEAIEPAVEGIASTQGENPQSGASPATSSRSAVEEMRQTIQNNLQCAVANGTLGNVVSSAATAMEVAALKALVVQRLEETADAGNLVSFLEKALSDDPAAFSPPVDVVAQPPASLEDNAAAAEAAAAEQAAAEKAAADAAAAEQAAAEAAAAEQAAAEKAAAEKAAAEKAAADAAAAEEAAAEAAAAEQAAAEKAAADAVAAEQAAAEQAAATKPAESIDRPVPPSEPKTDRPQVHHSRRSEPVDETPAQQMPADEAPKQEKQIDDTPASAEIVAPPSLPAQPPSEAPPPPAQPPSPLPMEPTVPPAELLAGPSQEEACNDALDPSLDEREREEIYRAAPVEEKTRIVKRSGAMEPKDQIKFLSTRYMSLEGDTNVLKNKVSILDRDMAEIRHQMSLVSRFMESERAAEEEEEEFILAEQAS